MKRLNRICCVVMVVAILFLQAGSAAASIYDTLRPGMEGERVRLLQTGLHSLGHSLSVDGKYGPQTEQAVQAFQRSERLEADGLAGRLTLTALYRLAPVALPPEGSVPVTPVTQPQAEPQIPSQEAPSTGAEATVYTSNRGSLNLRSRPSHGNTTIYQLPFGTRVQILGVSGSWTRVSALGQTGYVQSSFLRPVGENSQPVAATNPPSQANPAPTQAPVAGVSGQAVVITQNRGSLNLRDRASYSGRVMLTIPYQATVSVLSRSGAWTQVQYRGQNGYVVDSFLRHNASVNQTPVVTLAPTAAPSAAPTAAPSVLPLPATSGVAFVNTVNGRTLNFRSAPREADNIIGQLPMGAALLLVSRGAVWCEVIYNGQQGFVMTSFLRFEENAPTAPTASPSPTPVPEATQPVPTEAPEVFTRVLRPGDSGSEVRELQSRLIALKYTLSLTGTYDAVTKEAVRQFQLLNSLDVDGIFGSQSAQVLLSGAARPGDSTPLSYTTLRIDNNNQAVTAMQEALKALGYPLSVNGRFDVATHQAVVGFQQRNGLPLTGIANPLTQSTIFSPGAKPYSTPVAELDASAGKEGGPSSGTVRLLHWFEDIKPRFSSGQTITVYHPASGISFKVRFYSMGNHADSEPATWRDTQLMNRAFGSPSWNINTVYIKLPNGTWTLAAMHNRPHLSGAISNNGFGGHLCIHFLRDMDEVMRNDPDYGASNQRAIRKAWLAMTGETID